MDHAAVETALVDQFEIHAYIVGERSLATSHHDGMEK
jgi:hypothetical protein